MRTSWTSTNRALLVICVTSAGWAFSFGVGAPLASLWLKDAGCNETLIGLNTAVYYGGLALAALVVPALMRRFGSTCTVAGMAISGPANLTRTEAELSNVRALQQGRYAAAGVVSLSPSAALIALGCRCGRPAI